MEKTKNDGKYFDYVLVGFVGLGLVAVTGPMIIDMWRTVLNHSYRQERVLQQNLLGNEKPETYVEINGVKYYSHIDGKEISDLVK